MKYVNELSSVLRRIADEIADLTPGDVGEVLVSGREAARLLGKNPTTISLMVRDGRLVKKTIGESTGIPLSEIWRLKSS